MAAEARALLPPSQHCTLVVSYHSSSRHRHSPAQEAAELKGDLVGGCDSTVFGVGKNRGVRREEGGHKGKGPKQDLVPIFPPGLTLGCEARIKGG